MVEGVQQGPVLVGTFFLATKGRGRGQGRGSGPPLKDELNAALELSDALTTVDQAPGGLSAQQATYSDHLHVHIHNMDDSAEQVDTHLAQLYARTACGEQLLPAELHQCKQLLEWRAQGSKN